MNVVLDPVPARVFVEYIDHLDSLLHEFRIMASGHESGAVPVGAEVYGVVETVLSSYAGVKDEAYLAARHAVERGEDTVTLRVDLPPEAADAAEQLLQAIEEADAMARHEGLLTLPASPAVLGFARWALPELARQLQGQAASAFDGGLS